MHGKEKLLHLLVILQVQQITKLLLLMMEVLKSDSLLAVGSVSSTSGKAGGGKIAEY